MIEAKPNISEMVKPVKLVQPSISSYFNLRKTDLGNKENPIIQKYKSQRRKSASLTTTRISRKKSPKLKSPQSEILRADKRREQSVISINKTHPNVGDTTSSTSSSELVQTSVRYKIEDTLKKEKQTFSTYEEKIVDDGHLAKDSEDVLFGCITIPISDSDDEVDVTEDGEEQKLGKSPSKNDISTSASKRIKSETNQSTGNFTNVKRELFGDKESDGNLLMSSMFDDDTVDLNLCNYGVPVEELEMYEPSMNESQFLQMSLQSTSFHNKNNHSTKIHSNDKYDPDATIICKIEDELIKINSESDLTTDERNILDYTNVSQSNNQTLFNNTKDTINETNTSAMNETAFGTEVPIKNAMKKAWYDVQKSSYIALHNDSHSLDIFFSLGDEHLEICLRLFARQTKWQRVDKFVSAIKLHLPTDDLNETLNQLNLLNYVYTDLHERESLETVLNLMQLPELKQLAKSRHIKHKNKPAIVSALCKFVTEQPSLGGKTTENVLRAEIGAKMGLCICLTDDTRSSLFRLQLLHHFAVPDIASYYDFYTYMDDLESGHVVLPDYIVCDDVMAFNSLNSFDRYAKAVELQFTYTKYQGTRSKKGTKKNPLLAIAQEAFTALKDLHTQQPDISPIHPRFTAEHVYAKILTLAITDLTRHVPEVMTWLEYLVNQDEHVPQRGEWYEKLAMHLEQREHKYKEAADIINRGLAHKDVAEIDKINLTVRAERLIKRKHVFANVFSNLGDVPTTKDVIKTVIMAKQCKVSQFKGQRMVYREEEELFTVEEVAIRHYVKHDYPNGIHCEGALLLTLFAALFWDIIYSDVPGAFISHLQYIPLDLYSREFYAKRKTEIDRRLKDISSGWEMEKFLECLRMFNDHHSHKKSIHDSNLNKDMIEAAECIGRGKLAKLLERLVKDMRQYRAGLPDLFVWNYALKKCVFVEVKSHNDKLSRKQEVWLQFLADIKVPVELCLVNSIGQKVSKARTQVP